MRIVFKWLIILVITGGVLFVGFFAVLAGWHYFYYDKLTPEERFRYCIKESFENIDSYRVDAARTTATELEASILAICQARKERDEQNIKFKQDKESLKKKYGD